MKDIKPYLPLYLKSWCSVKGYQQTIAEKEDEDAFGDGEWALSCRVLEKALMGKCQVIPHLRPFSDMTDAEALHIAELAYGAGNVKNFDKPSFHRYEEDTVKCILVINNCPKPIKSWSQVLALRQITDAVEIDHGFNVQPNLGGITEMPEIVLYCITQGFWIFGDEYFEQGLVIDKTKQETTVE